MIPRFSNLHVIHASTKLTSRADLRDSEDETPDTIDEHLPMLRKRLRELVQDKLGDLTVVSDENLARRKRQKVAGSLEDVEQETICAFAFLRQLIPGLIH
jgi:hypothetical protein